MPSSTKIGLLKYHKQKPPSVLKQTYNHTAISSSDKTWSVMRPYWPAYNAFLRILAYYRSILFESLQITEREVGVEELIEGGPLIASWVTQLIWRSGTRRFQLRNLLILAKNMSSKLRSTQGSYVKIHPDYDLSA